MSAFTDLLEEYLGADGDAGDIRAVVRRCWLYDFNGTPVRLWQGQGVLITTGGVRWLGTIDANGTDRHEVPGLADGRDGASVELRFSLPYIDAATYASLKADSGMVAGGTITCYLALFQPGEGLRIETPIDFFARYTMRSPIFEESVAFTGSRMTRTYRATVLATNGNSGLSRSPGGSYSDTCQKQRAAMLGVALDRGCEFVAGLANASLQLP